MIYIRSEKALNTQFQGNSKFRKKKNCKKLLYCYMYKKKKRREKIIIWIIECHNNILTYCISMWVETCNFIRIFFSLLFSKPSANSIHLSSFVSVLFKNFFGESYFYPYKKWKKKAIDMFRFLLNYIGRVSDYMDAESSFFILLGIDRP